MTGGAQVMMGPGCEAAAVPVPELPGPSVPGLGAVCPSESCPLLHDVLGAVWRLCSSWRVPACIEYAIECPSSGAWVEGVKRCVCSSKFNSSLPRLSLWHCFSSVDSSNKSLCFKLLTCVVYLSIEPSIFSIICADTRTSGMGCSTR